MLPAESTQRRGQGGTEEGGDPQAGPVGAPGCPRVRIRLGGVRGGERGPCPSEMGKRGTHGQGQDARVVLDGGGCLAPRLVHEDAEQLPQHPLCGWGLRHHRPPHGDGDAAGPPGCQQGLPRPGCCPRWWWWGGVDETRWAPYLVQVGEHCSRLATVSLGCLLASASRALSRL